MSGLSALKFTNSKRQQGNSPQHARRQKLCSKLDEQILLAKAEQSGEVFKPMKIRSIKDEATGETRRAEVPKKLTPWWWRSENGKLCISVRYGARVLEIVEGKNVIEADSIADVITSLQIIKTAVDSGELDARIQAVTDKNETPVAKSPTQQRKSTLKLPFRNN